jgi:hypothetical protein
MEWLGGKHVRTQSPLPQKYQEPSRSINTTFEWNGWGGSTEYLIVVAKKYQEHSRSINKIFEWNGRGESTEHSIAVATRTLKKHQQCR